MALELQTCARERLRLRSTQTHPKFQAPLRQKEEVLLWKWGGSHVPIIILPYLHRLAADMTCLA